MLGSVEISLRSVTAYFSYQSWSRTSASVIPFSSACVHRFALLGSGQRSVVLHQGPGVTHGESRAQRVSAERFRTAGQKRQKPQSWASNLPTPNGPRATWPGRDLLLQPLRTPAASTLGGWTQLSQTNNLSTKVSIDSGALTLKASPLLCRSLEL